MFKDYLENKNCFKLVCGAGNNDLKGIEELVNLYYQAGCRFFDVSMSEEVVKLVKSTAPDAYICISTGIKDDPHLSKAQINFQKCRNCHACQIACPQKAIDENLNILKNKCIGCKLCQVACKFNAMNMVNEKIDIKELLPPLLKYNPDCIELHAIGDDEADIDEKWNYIEENFDGMMSLCLDRSKLSDEAMLNRINRLIKNRKPYTTIIQADGAPMSGGVDDYHSTLQAVATADIVQKFNLPVYLLISGGTNSKTLDLAHKCKVYPHGIAIGSYARTLKTVEEAKNLINSCQSVHE